MHLKREREREREKNKEEKGLQHAKEKFKNKLIQVYRGENEINYNTTHSLTHSLSADYSNKLKTASQQKLRST